MLDTCSSVVVMVVVLIRPITVPMVVMSRTVPMVVMSRTVSMVVMSMVVMPMVDWTVPVVVGWVAHGTVPGTMGDSVPGVGEGIEGGGSVRGSLIWGEVAIVVVWNVGLRSVCFRKVDYSCRCSIWTRINFPLRRPFIIQLSE